MDTKQSWDWASVGSTTESKEAAPEPTRTQPEQSQQPQTSSNEQRPQRPQASANEQYGPRTCRICLDTEQPKYPDRTTAFGISTTSSRPTYTSDDPELGRLLSPCKCKGSQKYVHEGCLNAWRLANPMEARNYWQCPTCKFTYRISRLHWSSVLSSKWAQIGLTVLFLIISLFILGFIADPLFDLWYDPVGTISETVTSVVTDIEAQKPSPYQTPATWYEHFLKGFFSLGIVGIFKTMIASPIYWWNMRSSVFGNRGRQGGGRDRVENISLLFVIIGAFTFLMAVWKGVKALSARVLKNVSDRVLDVDEDEDSAS